MLWDTGKPELSGEEAAERLQGLLILHGVFKTVEQNKCKTDKLGYGMLSGSYELSSVPSTVPGQSHNRHCYCKAPQVHKICPHNLPEHRKAEAAAQPTGSFHCYCPCWTAVYSERCLRRMLSEVSKWQSPRTYQFLPFPSLEGWQILQNLRCSLPLSEPGLLTQCPVQEKDNIKESSNQWHTDTSSATTCTTRRGLLSAFMASNQPILHFSRRWGKKTSKSRRSQEKGLYYFSITVSLLILFILCICTVQPAVSTQVI